MKKLTLIFILLATLSICSCVSTSFREASASLGDITEVVYEADAYTLIPTDSFEEVALVEEDKEQFIAEAHAQGFEVFYFKEDEGAKEHGYGFIYVEKNGEVSTLNSGYLEYNQHVGKLCYFKDPIDGEYGTQFLPLVTQMGEIVYVQFYTGNYGDSPLFINGSVGSYDKLVETQNLISSNFHLFENYDVKIEDAEIYSYDVKYILSDGNTIWKSSYDFLHDLVGKLSFENAEQRKAFISNALYLGISTTYDDFDEETEMSVYATDDIELNAYVTNDGSLWHSFILLSYSGGSWKFIDRVRMKSNSIEYSFSEKSYRSTMSGGNVFEAVTASISSNNELFNFLINACESGSLKIRMSGSNGSVDLSINDEQLHKIEAFLRVIEVLENN